VSVYGLGRFPVTLYKEQWIRLLDMGDDIRSFIAENAPKLKVKEDSIASHRVRSSDRFRAVSNGHRAREGAAKKLRLPPGPPPVG